MTSHHDTDARLEMLKETIDRNRDKVSDSHDFEQREKQEKQTAKPR